MQTNRELALESALRLNIGDAGVVAAEQIVEDAKVIEDYLNGGPRPTVVVTYDVKDGDSLKGLIKKWVRDGGGGDVATAFGK